MLFSIYPIHFYLLLSFPVCCLLVNRQIREGYGCFLPNGSVDDRGHCVCRPDAGDPKVTDYTCVSLLVHLRLYVIIFVRACVYMCVHKQMTVILKSKTEENVISNYSTVTL